MRKMRVCLATAAALTLALAGCGDDPGSSPGGSGETASDETIVIGSIHPLTGALAGAGSLMDKAAQMAAEDINAAGGIESMGGAELEISSGDSQGKAEVGQSEAQRLVESGAVALVGTYQSDVTQNVAAVAERSQVPLVIDVAVDDMILQQGYTYTFRIQPDATGMGTAGADALASMGEEAGDPVETVSFIHVEGAYGDSVFQAFKKQAEASGMSVVAEVTYAGANFNDATTQVSEAVAAGPDAIAITGYYPDSLLIAQSIAALAPDVKAVFGVANGGFDDERFPNDAAAAGQAILSANYHYAATSERVADIRERFGENYGEVMQTAAMLSYQAVEVIAAGLEEAGEEADPVALREAIAGVSVDDSLLAFDGPITFDETGQNENATVIVMQVLGGKVEQVYPKEFATADLVYPATPGQG